MSIFKETFKDFVSTQLRIREAIIKQGSSSESSRFGPRTIINVNGNNKKIDIAAGAFYTNTVNKQCVIRMASGVDITDEILVGEFGEDISKKYILEGGILQENGQPKKGFGVDNGAYGDKFTRSEGGDGFGIVPMPGIIEADIRTKSAYGSLREANVSFVCHNRRQLEILELLYMRPGMPILLEWQWSPFIDERGQISNKIFSIIDKENPGKEDWFDPSKKITDFNLEIVNNKNNSNGNYDGFVGFCKNFEFTSRPDGGYNCTTELIAAGEILESLKTRSDGFAIIKEDQVLPLDNLQVVFEGIIELDALFSSATEPNVELAQTTAAAGGPAVTGTTAFVAFTKYVDLGKYPVARQLLIETQGIDIGNETKTNLSLDVFSENSSFEEEVIKPLQQYRDDYSKYFIFEGEEIGSKSVFFNEVPTNASDTFIRWDYLVDLMNRMAFPLYDPSDEDSTLLKLTYEQPKNGNYNNLEYLEFIDYKIDNQSELKKIKKIKDKYYFLQEVVDIEDILNNSFNPKVCLLPRQTPEFKGITNSKKIGHIMLNVKHLRNVYNKMAYDEDKPVEDFSLFNYITKIWQDVNNACAGKHKFILQTELERPDTIRIIDLQVNSDINQIKPEELFEFKIQSNESVVRDFNFNTTIPSGLSATIAIAAQAPTSISNLDQVTFANFTQGIKSRFTTNVELPISKDYSSLKTKYETDKKTYQQNVLELASYLNKLQIGNLDGQGTSIDGLGFSEAIGLAKNIERSLISLSQRNPKTGERIPIIPESRSEVIPLKFNASMDGISGIVIGNVFKIEKEKLPIGYQDENIAFVVLGESQRITSGQDWTTEISGQIILLNNTLEGTGLIEYGSSGAVDEGTDQYGQNLVEKQETIDRFSGVGGNIPLDQTQFE